MSTRQNEPIPVILDTDIGTDIDDSWALVMLLNSPELRPELITTATLNTEQRTVITAKMLEAAKRTDIPIGTGFKTSSDPLRMSPWVENYDIKKYKGSIYSDGVDAMINTIMNSKEKVTLISIGPLTNVAMALKKEPRIAEKARFVGMHGSIAKQHGGIDGAIAEYNVVQDLEASRIVFGASWDMAITPLDTCGIVRLDGELYKCVKECKNPLTKSLVDSYRVWLGEKSDEGRSSILYDTVAIYLAFAEEFLDVRELPIGVTKDGFTKVDEKNKKIRCALHWKSLESFKEFLVERLI